ncbi:50S ribosomal protein L18 [Vampirovibrio sp.]|uniref:50S ribosomal protein L18 n=1 Tax=Vampirovibrio sp. TaxID=2717857 RepID=UPI0035940D80
MLSKINRKEVTRKRHYRLRRRLTGSSERPRLAVYRSGKHIYAQLIDDLKAITIASASSLDKELRSESGANIEAARKVGEMVAKRAQAAGITSVVFDRGGNLYHGRIAALAEAAREAGLEF